MSLVAATYASMSVGRELRSCCSVAVGGHVGRGGCTCADAAAEASHALSRAGHTPPLPARSSGAMAWRKAHVSSRAFDGRQKEGVLTPVLLVLVHRV